MTTARNEIQIHFTSLEKRGLDLRSMLLLVVRRVVFFEEVDVLIKTFGSVKNVEVVLRNYKIIEFMVSKFRHAWQLIVKGANILDSLTYTRQISHQRDDVFII